MWDFLHCARPNNVHATSRNTNVRLVITAIQNKLQQGHYFFISVWQEKKKKKALGLDNRI